MFKAVVSLPREIIEGIAAKRIREYALRFANDRRFRELWDYLFARTYGPLEGVA